MLTKKKQLTIHTYMSDRTHKCGDCLVIYFQGLSLDGTWKAKLAVVTLTCLFQAKNFLETLLDIL